MPPRAVEPRYSATTKWSTRVVVALSGLAIAADRVASARRREADAHRSAASVLRGFATEVGNASQRGGGSDGRGQIATTYHRESLICAHPAERAPILLDTPLCDYWVGRNGRGAPCPAPSIAATHGSPFAFFIATSKNRTGNCGCITVGTIRRTVSGVGSDSLNVPADCDSTSALSMSIWRMGRSP